MSLKVRMTGPLLVAMIIIPAVFAPASQGAEFHNQVVPAYGAGNQVTENTLSTHAGKIKCKKAVFSGKGATFTGTVLNLGAAYSECTAFGQAALILTNGCSYSFTASSSTAGNYSIACPAGKVIQVSVPAGNCSITIGAQTPGVSAVDYKNEGAGATRDILITFTVAKIKFTTDGPGTLCGPVGTFEGSTGAAYTGTVTLKEFSDEGLTVQAGIWVE